MHDDTVRSSITHHTIPTRLVGKDVVLNATCVVGLVISNNDRLRSVIGNRRLHKAMTLWFVRRQRGGQATSAWDSGTGKSLVRLPHLEVFRRECSQLRRGPHAG